MFESRRWWQKSIFLIPATLLMLGFFIWPAITSVYYSFTNLALTGANAANFRFVGLDNYARMLKDTNVIRAIVNTFKYTLGSIVGQTLLGFTVAYAMKDKGPNIRRIVGTLIIAGWVVPEVVAAYCMNSFFNEKGTLNSILGIFGIEGVSWLYSFPMLSVVLANIWRGTAFSMMAYQAALDGVDDSLIESSKMDGCGFWGSLVHVTIPVIKSTIVTNSMLITLMTLGGFGLIWIMTGGGPGGRTQTLPVLMYVKAFSNSQMGYGVAISMILLVIGVAFGIVYTRILGRQEIK